MERQKGLPTPFGRIECRSSDGIARAGRGSKVIWEMSVEVSKPHAAVTLMHHLRLS